MILIRFIIDETPLQAIFAKKSKKSPMKRQLKYDKVHNKKNKVKRLPYITSKGMSKQTRKFNFECT